MAYQSGTVNNIADIVSTLNTFAAANGWTNTSGVLSGGLGHVEVTANATYPDDVLLVKGANNVDMTTGLCPQNSGNRFYNVTWPLNYYLHAFTVPTNLIVMFINYSTTKWQWVIFGDIEKYVTFTGGNFFSASFGTSGSSAAAVVAMTETGTANGGSAGYSSMGPGLFWHTRNYNSFNGGYSTLRGTHLHAEIDGYIWPGAGSSASDNFPTFSNRIDPISQNNQNPNKWDLHSPLLPYWVWMPRSDGKTTPIGHVPNVRFIRNTYIDPGEIITIGADKWKVYPFHERDVNNPTAWSESARTSGTMALAVSYDGP